MENVELGTELEIVEIAEEFEALGAMEYTI